MVDEITTFLAVVGAVTGTISIALRILDERIRLKVTVNKFEVVSQEFSEHVDSYFDIDFDVSNTSKKQNSIRNIHFKIPSKGLSLNPDRHVEVSAPGLESTIEVLSGTQKPIFDVPPGTTVNQKHSFCVDELLDVERLDFELVLTDTYGKEIRNRLPQPKRKKDFRR